MRAVIGVLLLFAIFLAAAHLQGRWEEENRASSRGLLIQPERAEQRGDEAAQGWARLTIGRPSNAEPVEVIPPPAEEANDLARRRMISGGSSQPVDRESKSNDAPPPRTEEPERPADWVMTIRPDQTLSEICQEFYGTASPSVYNKLAEYNGLEGPDDIRLGQKLRLPATKELLLNGE